jgi:hypothetical protein
MNFPTIAVDMRSLLVHQLEQLVADGLNHAYVEDLTALELHNGHVAQVLHLETALAGSEGHDERSFRSDALLYLFGGLGGSRPGFVGISLGVGSSELQPSRTQAQTTSSNPSSSVRILSSHNYR